MTKIYKTARGKSVDFDKIKLSNETAIAVGNMKVNARGDLLGAGGQVAKGRNQIMDELYSVEPGEIAESRETMQPSTPQKLIDLTNNLTVSTTDTPPADDQTTDDDSATANPTTRGSLASSIAKTATVEQKPMPSPKELAKSKGPSRI